MNFIKKKLLQRQNFHSQINSHFTPATNLKIGTYILIPKLITQKGISKTYNLSERTISNFSQTH